MSSRLFKCSAVDLICLITLLLACDHLCVSMHIWSCCTYMYIYIWSFCMYCIYLKLLRRLWQSSFSYFISCCVCIHVLDKIVLCKNQVYIQHVSYQICMYGNSADCAFTFIQSLMPWIFLCWPLPIFLQPTKLSSSPPKRAKPKPISTPNWWGGTVQSCVPLSISSSFWTHISKSWRYALFFAFPTQ